MELIEGRTLESALNEMTPDDHVSITSDLKMILDELCRLKQDSKDAFIGKISLSSEAKNTSESSNQSNVPISTGRIVNSHIYDKPFHLGSFSRTFSCSPPYRSSTPGSVKIDRTIIACSPRG